MRTKFCLYVNQFSIDDAIERFIMNILNCFAFYGAAVKRLFSLKKIIAKPKRCSLTDPHFKTLALAKEIEYCSARVTNL